MAFKTAGQLRSGDRITYDGTPYAVHDAQASGTDEQTLWLLGDDGTRNEIRIHRNAQIEMR